MERCRGVEPQEQAPDNWGPTEERLGGIALPKAEVGGGIPWLFLGNRSFEWTQSFVKEDSKKLEKKTLPAN